MPREAQKVTGNLSLATFKRLQDEHNAMVDYMRSLRPLASNTEGLVHTAVGTRREGGSSLNQSSSANTDAVWG